MIRQSKVWRVMAALYLIINVGGAWYAFAIGERMHGEVHIALLVIAFMGYLILRLKAELRRRDLPRAEQPDGRIEYLQQSVDAVALEVERIGEAQRFNEKLRAKREESSYGGG